jgi:hypothetical protein
VELECLRDLLLHELHVRQNLAWHLHVPEHETVGLLLLQHLTLWREILLQRTRVAAVRGRIPRQGRKLLRVVHAGEGGFEIKRLLVVVDISAIVVVVKGSLLLLLLL